MRGKRRSSPGLVAALIASIPGGLARRSANPRQPEPAAEAEEPKPDPVVAGEIPPEPLAFVERAAIGRLAGAAGPGESAVRCSVTGLRGTGKTQVAAAYARSRIAAGWGLIGWVNAGSLGVLLADLALVAEAAGVADPEGDSARSAQRLRDHLEARTEPGLLVFDNATDPGALQLFLPATGGTQLVVTSTGRAFDDWGVRVEVPEFTRPESAKYLIERSGQDDQPGADAVAAELGDLPLALAQAAAVISRPRWTLRRYLGELARVRVEMLLGRVPGEDYPRAAAVALLLSVQAAEDADPSGLASLVLRVVAVLSPDGVSRDLLSGLGPESGNAAGDVDDALGLCEEGSLLASSQARDAVIMHRLLAQVLRERDQTFGCWHETVQTALDLVEPMLFGGDEARARRAEGAKLAIQVEALWEASNTTGPVSRELAGRLLQARSWAVRQLCAAADLTLATDIATRVVADSARVLGEDHPGTVTARGNLAAVTEAARRADAAEAARQAAVTEAARSADEVVPELAQSVDEVVPEPEQSVDEVVAMVGGDQSGEHPGTETARGKHAAVAGAEGRADAAGAVGRVDEAIPLYERILADRERTLGSDHAGTMAARNNLAGAYESAGRVAEAIPLYEQTLAGSVGVLGGEHPGALAARNNLAAAYESAGRVAEAIPLYEQTLAESIRVLGEDHPGTVAARGNLAGAYESAGRVDAAIRLYEQVLADAVRVLGGEHPGTLTARNNLAGAYESAGRVDAAIRLYEQNLADAVRVLGEDHPGTLTARNSLAAAYEAAGRRR